MYSVFVWQKNMIRRHFCGINRVNMERVFHIVRMSSRTYTGTVKILKRFAGNKAMELSLTRSQNMEEHDCRFT